MVPHLRRRKTLWGGFLIFEMIPSVFRYAVLSECRIDFPRPPDTGRPRRVQGMALVRRSFINIPGPMQVFRHEERSCRRAGGALQCQCSGGKQRIVHPEQSISISKYLPPKGSPETFGFWRPFGDFSGGGKVTPPAGGISREAKSARRRNLLLVITNNVW